MFRDPETGARMSKKSVEALRKRLGDHTDRPIKRRDEAVRICQKALEQGIAGQTVADQNLKEYLIRFWDYDTSLYIERKNTINPGAISKDYAYTRSILLKNHVLPLVPTGLSIMGVRMKHLRNIQYQLVKQGTIANATINLAMSTILIALRNAENDGLLPTGTIKTLPMMQKQQNERGILSETELSTLLSYMKEHCDPRIYLASAVSVITGMRSGELRALTTRQIKDGLILVDEAYANLAGRKAPKGKKSREVPCPRYLCDQLLTLAHANLHLSKETLVFWSKRTGGPVSSHYFSEKLRDALIRSEIMDERELEKRNISFHSFRHMANTMLRGSIDEQLLRLTIGHSGTSMSDLYTHLTERARKSVEIAQELNILPFIPGPDPEGVPSDHQCDATASSYPDQNEAISE
jgi:integrase